MGPWYCSFLQKLQDSTICSGMKYIWQVYAMMMKDSGSVETEVCEGTISAYQHQLHSLKASSVGKIKMPQKLK